jgi:ligand-binding sensor domain-containing protein/signal transduction histidine kinase
LVSEQAGQPVVGRNADGQLEVFTVTDDGELRHRRQNRANGDWSAWLGLGGKVLPGIGIELNARSEIQVFGVGREDGTLWTIQQRGTNSANWSEWTNLGGSGHSPVTMARNAEGRLEVFATGLNGAVQHLWQTNAHGNWSAWSTLGAVDGGITPQLAVAKNLDGRLELFGTVAGGNRVVHCWQRSPGGNNDWTGWTDLGGSILPGIAVARNVRGVVEIFGVDSTNGAVNRRCQAAPGNSLEWSDWERFGARVKPGLAVEQSVGQSAYRLEIWAVNADDSMLTHRWETMMDGSDQWSQWESAGQAAASCPAVGQNEDGNLEVFAVDAHDGETIMHRRQIGSSSGWLEWLSLDHRTVQYNSRRWQVDEGLPDNLVQALAQTRDGYLWVGTQNGLAKFDGVTFTVYNAGNTPELKNSSITALCADRNGALWIGTDGGGLLYLKDGHYQRFTRTNGLAGDQLRVIYESKNGSLWIGTATGLSHLAAESAKFISNNQQRGSSRPEPSSIQKLSTTNYKVRNGLLSEVVSHICEDRDSNLWIATGKGLNRLRTNGVMDSFTMPNALPNDAVRGICQDRGGQIWIGSNNGLLWYNSFWRSFYAYNTRYGLSDRFVSAICEDREGDLWVGTYSGLNRFNRGRFYNVLDNEGLPFDRVNTLLEDREGDVWVGSREGLVRLTPKRFSTITRRQGLTHDNVTSVLQDHNGSLWIGTWGGGVNELKDDQVIPSAVTNMPGMNVVLSPPQSPFWKGSDVPLNAQSPGLVLSLCEGRDGSLWIGADFDGGLTRLKDGAVTRYTWKAGLTNGGLRVLHEDREGNLWIGANRALCRLTNGKVTKFTAKDGFDGQAVHAICEDRKGDLWFGTDTGLRRWHEGQFKSYTTNEGLSSNRILALYGDEQDNLWIGTAGGGLNRIRLAPSDKADAQKHGQSPHPLHITSYTKEQGLFSDEIFAILEDAGWLWMSCSKGVFRVSKANLDQLPEGTVQTITSIAYGKADGMESPQCNGTGQPAAWKARDGTLWFATIKGVISADPRTIKTDRTGPAVIVTGLVADQKAIEVEGLAMNTGSQGEASSAFHAPSSLQIPPGRGELELDYTALNLSAPEKSRFQYKLEGVDSAWVDAGAHRAAHYNNVRPGHYRFQVRACNKDGVWSKTGAELAIVYLPNYWQTWWFLSLALAGFVGGIAGVARYLTRRKLQRQLALAEQRHAIERERGRIAKDIHDDLGASLTRIMLLGHSAEEGLTRREDVGTQVQKIVQSARRTVQALDEIVWAINPQNDTLDGLVAYIGHYADELFENSNINCRLEIPFELPALTLAAETRHNLFLVVKEAFHNVLKHSEASEAHLRISATARSLRIEIEDNGCGFDPESYREGGRKRNGLENMRQRMKHLGGHMELTSAPEQGARLTFRIEFNADSLN